MAAIAAWILTLETCEIMSLSINAELILKIFCFFQSCVLTLTQLIESALLIRSNLHVLPSNLLKRF